MEAELIEKEQIALKHENAQEDERGASSNHWRRQRHSLNDEGVRRAAVQDRANTLERRGDLGTVPALAEARVRELEEISHGWLLVGPLRQP